MKKTTIVPDDHISWLIPEIWWDELCASQTVLSNVYYGMQKRKGDGEFVLVESFQTRCLRIWEGNFFPTCSWWAPHGQACQRRSCRSPCRRGWTIGIAWTDVYIEYSVCCVLTWSCSSPCGHQGPWPWSSWHRLSWRPILKIERDEYHVFGHARYLNFVEALDLNRPPITNIVKMRRKVEHYDGIYP